MLGKLQLLGLREEVNDLALIATIGLGVTFLLASAAKAQELDEFARVLEQSRIVDRSRARLLAIAITVVESSVGVLLVSGLLLDLAMVAATVLLTFFSVFVLWGIVKRANIVCGCFGRLSDGRITWSTLFRNVLLLLISVAALMTKAPSWWPKQFSGSDYAAGTMYALTVAGGVYLTLVYLRTSTLFFRMPALPMAPGIEWEGEN